MDINKMGQTPDKGITEEAAMWFAKYLYTQLMDHAAAHPEQYKPLYDLFQNQEGVAFSSVMDAASAMLLKVWVEAPGNEDQRPQRAAYAAKAAQLNSDLWHREALRHEAGAGR